MNQLEQNKVFQTLKEKINPPKTQTGLDVGWMVDCEVALFLKKANSVNTPPLSFPRWSCGCLYRHGKNIFGDMSQILDQAKEFLKKILGWLGFVLTGQNQANYKEKHKQIDYDK